jgi:hypothetical protein
MAQGLLQLASACAASIPEFSRLATLTGWTPARTTLAVAGPPIDCT